MVPTELEIKQYQRLKIQSKDKAEGFVREFIDNNKATLPTHVERRKVWEEFRKYDVVEPIKEPVVLKKKKHNLKELVLKIKEANEVIGILTQANFDFINTLKNKRKLTTIEDEKLRAICQRLKVEINFQIELKKEKKYGIDPSKCDHSDATSFGYLSQKEPICPLCGGYYKIY